jgi:hypothetical protein
MTEIILRSHRCALSVFRILTFALTAGVMKQGEQQNHVGPGGLIHPADLQTVLRHPSPMRAAAAPIPSGLKLRGAGFSLKSLKNLPNAFRTSCTANCGATQCLTGR